MQKIGRKDEREESKKVDKEWHNRTLMVFNGIIIKFIVIISVYSNYLIPLFSSPDPKDQVTPRVRWAIGITLRPSSVCPLDFFKNLLLWNHRIICYKTLHKWSLGYVDSNLWVFLRIISIYIKDVHTNWVVISMTFFPKYRMLKLVIFWLYFICGVHSQSTQLNFSYSFPARHILFCRL